MFYSLTNVLFRSVLFHFQIFDNFPDMFLLLTSNLIPLWSKNMLCTISLFKSVQAIYGPEYGLPWWISHIYMKGMHFLQALNGKFYKHHLDQIDYVTLMFWLTLCLFVLSIIERSWNLQTCGHTCIQTYIRTYIHKRMYNVTIKIQYKLYF